MIIKKTLKYLTIISCFFITSCGPLSGIAKGLIGGGTSVDAAAHGYNADTIYLNKHNIAESLLNHVVDVVIILIFLLFIAFIIGYFKKSPSEKKLEDLITKRFEVNNDKQNTDSNTK